MPTPRPSIRVHKRTLCRDNEASAHVAWGELGTNINAYVMQNATKPYIRLDIWSLGSEDEQRRVLVNIKAAQSLHPAIIVEAYLFEVLKRVADGVYQDNPDFRLANKYEYERVQKLRVMGLLDGEFAEYWGPTKEEPDRHLYDLSPVHLTQAGQYILAQVKEWKNV